MPNVRIGVHIMDRSELEFVDDDPFGGEFATAMGELEGLPA